MDETRERERLGEEARLLAHTQELWRRTKALSADRTPYDYPAHEALGRDLDVHREDLAHYRARFLDS